MLLCEYLPAPYGEARDGGPPRKTQLCKFFAEDGNCRKGDTCTFAHGDQELGTTLPPGAPICWLHKKARNSQYLVYDVEMGGMRCIAGPNACTGGPGGGRQDNAGFAWRCCNRTVFRETERERERNRERERELPFFFKMLFDRTGNVPLTPLESWRDPAPPIPMGAIPPSPAGWVRPLADARPLAPAPAGTTSGTR